MDPCQKNLLRVAPALALPGLVSPTRKIPPDRQFQSLSPAAGFHRPGETTGASPPVRTGNLSTRTLLPAMEGSCGPGHRHLPQPKWRVGPRNICGLEGRWGQWDGSQNAHCCGQSWTTNGRLLQVSHCDCVLFMYMIESPTFLEISERDTVKVDRYVPICHRGLAGDHRRPMPVIGQPLE